MYCVCASTLFRRNPHAQVRRIQAYLSSNTSQRKITRILKVDSSTISRELKRNWLPDQIYQADAAHHRSAAAQTTQAANRLQKVIPEHLAYIHEPWRDGHSPEVIGETLDNPQMRLSTSWVYELLNREIKNGDDECTDLLPHKYRKCGHLKSSDGSHLIPDRVEVAAQPATCRDPRRVRPLRIGRHRRHSPLLRHRHASGTLYPVALVYRRRSAHEATGRYQDRGRFATIRRLSALDRLRQLRSIPYPSTDRSTPNCSNYVASPYHSWERHANQHIDVEMHCYAPKGETEMAYPRDCERYGMPSSLGSVWRRDEDTIFHSFVAILKTKLVNQRQFAPITRLLNPTSSVTSMDSTTQMHEFQNCVPNVHCSKKHPSLQWRKKPRYLMDVKYQRP